MNNVHAPNLWFDRLFREDVSSVSRICITLDSGTGKYYLSEYEEARLLFRMIYEGNYRIGEGTYHLYTKSHPVKQRAVFRYVLQRRQAIPPTRNVVLGKKGSTSRKLTTNRSV